MLPNGGWSVEITSVLDLVYRMPQKKTPPKQSFERPPSYCLLVFLLVFQTSRSGHPRSRRGRESHADGRGRGPSMLPCSGPIAIPKF